MSRYHCNLYVLTNPNTIVGSVSKVNDSGADNIIKVSQLGKLKIVFSEKLKLVQYNMVGYLHARSGLRNIYSNLCGYEIDP